MEPERRVDSPRPADKEPTEPEQPNAHKEMTHEYSGASHAAQDKSRCADDQRNAQSEQLKQRELRIEFSGHGDFNRC